MTPSVEVCFHIMAKYRMLENIKAHSVVVAKLARLIARGLQDGGVNVSVEKATAGALMHDIGKTASLQSGQDHAEIGRQICVRNNMDEIAGIVGEHVKLKNYDLKEDYSEKEIVFYADKRVKHDRVVSLDERLEYILGRYGRNHEELCTRIKKNFELCREVEQKLFAKLDVGPEALSKLVKNEEIGEDVLLTQEV